MCLIRYLSIRNDGINLTTKYSRLTWSKLYLSYGMSLVYLLPVLFGLTIPEYWLKNRFYYGFLYLIYSIIWSMLAIITQIEHSRKLVNEWYCHHMFYVLNILFILGFSIVILAKYSHNRDYADFVFMSVEFVAAFSINTMTFMTNRQKRRPLEKKNTSISFDLMSPKNAKNSFKEHPIQVFLDLSLRNDDFIHFQTITEKSQLKVTRSFNEFIDIQNYLLEYMQRILPERIQEVPIIDKSDLSNSRDITMALERKFMNIDNFLTTLAKK